jgi:hypothetical protein
LGPYLLVIVVLAAMALVAWWVAGRFGGGDGGGGAAPADRAAPAATTASPAINSPTADTAPPGGVNRTDPAFRIEPQRARAGSPIQLEARGEGCAGGSGVLSVVEVGAVDAESPPGRLVLRRRFDVAGDGTWATAPLLVGQPEGKYRVTAACERRPTVDGLVPVEQRRDLFEASELLELTGPANLRAFQVAPRTPVPGEAVVVRLTGAGDCPGGRVSGTVFPLTGQSAPAKPFDAVPDSAGNWAASVSFAAAEAAGSYSVEAACADRFAFATEHVRFVSRNRFELPDFGGRRDRSKPATPVRGIPTFTG